MDGDLYGGGFKDYAKDKARKAKNFAKRGMNSAYESMSGMANGAYDSASDFAVNMTRGLITGGEDSRSARETESRHENRTGVAIGLTTAAALVSLALAYVRSS